MRELTFSPLAILQNPLYFQYDHEKDSWSLNEVATNRLACAVANCGVVEIRVLSHAPWAEHPYGLSSVFQPFLMNADRTKFDPSGYNSFYFPVLRRFMEIFLSYKIKTNLCLVDNCGLAGNYDRFNPWENNVQGIRSFYERAAWPLVKRFFEKCVDEFGIVSPGLVAKVKAAFSKTNLDLRVSFGNECQKIQMVDLVREAMLPVVVARKLDFKKLSYGAIMEEVEYKPLPPGWTPTKEQPKWDYYPGMAGTVDWLKKLVADTIGEDAKFKIWKECHGIGGKGYPRIPNRLHQVIYWWLRKDRASAKIRVRLSNDGVFDGNSLCDVEVDGKVTKRRPSAERMAEIIALCKPYANDISFEHLPKTKDLECIQATLRAMYMAMTGATPVEKWHYEEPAPVPEPQPEPIPGPLPEPPALPTCVEKYIKNRSVRHWQFGRYLLCKLGVKR